MTDSNTIRLSDINFRGILAGSKADFEALNAFLEEREVDLAPIVDKVFSFDEVPRAMEYLASGKHVGKVVVKVS